VTELIDTTEMYLRTILELEEEGIVPMRARIAERLAHSGPTVSQTVARMARDGLVNLAGDRHLELTDHGRLLATRVMRKHRIAERLLVDVLGLELEYVHDEACRWEHVISERVERKILALLGDWRESPYGNPIPGLDELGVTPGEGFRDGVRQLTLLAGERPALAVVKRLGEPVQVDPQWWAMLQGAGVLPGAVVEVCWDGGSVAVQVVQAGQPGGRAGRVVLSREAAAHVFASAFAGKS
jgi:DtxR family Mn-dependent transcriptional regulator